MTPVRERAQDSAGAVQSRSVAVADAVTLADLLRALKSRFKLLILCLAATCALGAAYVLLTPFRYRAEMAILIDPRERVPVGLDAQPMPQSPDLALVESHMRLLTSKGVLRDLVENERLAKDPEFAIKPGLLAPLKALISKPADPVEIIADGLAAMISVNRAEKSYVVDVSVLGSSPDRAERLARALFEAYAQSQRKLQDGVVNQQTLWLDQRIKDLYARLLQADEKVRDYRQTGAFLVSDGKVAPESQLRDANAALVAARGKRAEIEARLEQAQAAMRSGRADSLGEALRSTTIERLRGEYSALAREEASSRNILGPRHPAYLATENQMRAVEQQIAAELRRIAQSVERDLKAARKAEDSAEKLIAGLQSQTNDLGGRKSDLDLLERQAASVRAAYEKALATRENVRRDVVVAPVGFLADAPVAARSLAQPRIVPAAIVSLGAGFNLWIAICVFQLARPKRRDGAQPGAVAARAPADVAPLTDAIERAPVERAPSFSASLPFMDWARRGRLTRSAQWRQTPSGRRYLEAMRDLHAEARRRFGAGPLAIAVLSLGYYTGKSTVAAALAGAAGEAGERALLLDLDPVGAPERARGGGMRRESCSRRDLARRLARGDADFVVIDAGALSECARALRDTRLSGLVLVDHDETLEALVEDLADAHILHPVLAELAAPDLLTARRA